METLKQFRIESGMTQKELGEAVGVNRTVITHWENGDTSPRVEHLPRIADALGVSIDELVRGKEVEG